MKQRAVILSGLAMIVIWSAALHLPDKNIHLIFCDVGQGDAAIVVWGRVQVVIDGGPDTTSATDCLARHVPFYDKLIEAVILTHPHDDHAKGLTSVLERYAVGNFVKYKVEDGARVYQELTEVVKAKEIETREFVAGDRLVYKRGEKQLIVQAVWPEKSEYTSDLNESSLVVEVKMGDFGAVITGDATVQAEWAKYGSLVGAEVLKVPHHGSKTAMDDSWQAVVRPQLAVISVGKNSYGHPAGILMKRFADTGTKVLRTDIEGDIEVVSDGRGWWVRD